MVISSHLNEGFLDKAKQYAINLTASALIALSAVLPVKSQSLEGRLTDASTIESTGIPALMVTVPFGQTHSDEFGDYNITSNAVKTPKYELKRNNSGEIIISNINGQIVDKTEWNNQPFFWNKNISAGTYFADDGYSVYKFVNMGNGSWINMEPVATVDVTRGKNARTTQSLDDTYIFNVNGFVDLDIPSSDGWEGNPWYYNYTDTLSFNNEFNKDVQMIPRYNLESTDEDFLEYLNNARPLATVIWGDYPRNYPINVDLDSASCDYWHGDNTEIVLQDIRDALDDWNEETRLDLYNYHGVDWENRQIRVDYTPGGLPQFGGTQVRDNDRRVRINVGVIYLPSGYGLSGDYGKEVIRHEFGHGLGWVFHPNNSESIMRPSAYPPYITEIPDDDAYVVKTMTLLKNNTYWHNYIE